MKEIKFRAWDKTNDIMTYLNDNLFIQFFNDGWLIKDKAQVEYGDSFILNNNTGVLTQYTGLKDKNGKDIYEGDIINIYPEGDLREIIYSVDDGCFMADEKNSGHDVLHPRLWDEYAEIIGNIYENPNLLSNK